MPASYSSTRIRNSILYQKWDKLPDDNFTRLGVTRKEVKNLQGQLQGHVVLPDNSTYDKDRKLSNPVFDYFPSLIVYCIVESDARDTLAWVSQNKLQFTVRSGGHCTAGFSSGPGVLVDVSSLNSIAIDTENKTAIVGCGVTFGNLNKELNIHNLHVPGGECPDVCAGGYVQGGGYGFTSVTYGMNCDNVLSLKVLLADGSIVTATKSTNHDLWWAMRGGTGGNFGILLSIKYQLRELDDVFGFALIWSLETNADISAAGQAMMLLQDQYMYNSPHSPNLNIQVSLCCQSQIEVDGPSGTEKPYFMVRGLYVGDEPAGKAAIAALQAMPGCITQWTLVRPYYKMNDMLLSYPQEMPTVSETALEIKSCRYVEKMLTVHQWIEIIALFTKAELNTAYMYLEFYGGEISAAGKLNESAFIHRDVAYNAVMDVFWEAGADGTAAENFLKNWEELMDAAWNGHVYQNYPSLKAVDYAYEYWGHAVFALTLIKEKFDLNNLFSFAQQVPGTVMSDKADDWQVPSKLQTAINQDIDHTGGVKAPSSSKP